jgi:branched-chain amino acid transport system substrate-binding protein
MLNGANSRKPDGTVRIGVLSDQGSPFLAGPGSILAAQMAIDDSDAVKGMKVEIFVGDHKSKPEVGAIVARQWYEQQGVDAIFDVPNSAVALAVNEVARELGKPLIVSGAATADLTGKAKSPSTIHWTYDTWMLAHSTGEAIVKSGGDTWFFLTADYAFGHTLERETEAVVAKAGGKVIGRTRHAPYAPDLTEALKEAKASKAKIIGLANAGSDTTNAIEQAASLGIFEAGQNLAALLCFITDVHGVGLNKAQGLILTETFYWDHNEQTRDFANRFQAVSGGIYPTMVHAGVYSSVIHYLKSVDAAKTVEGSAVVRKMKELPTDDLAFGKGYVRSDGRKMHPAHLFEVKRPAESKYRYDYYKLRSTISAEKAFRPEGAHE